MPSDNINRMIQKASGELKATKIAMVSYEAYGPGGSMIIIDCETDNTNRSLTDVKALIFKTGGKMASEGSISWQFDLLGQIALEAKVANPNTPYGKEQVYDAIDIDQLQLDILDIPGVVDLQVDPEDNTINVLTERESLSSVRDHLMQLKLKVTEAQMIRLPQSYLELSDEDSASLESVVAELEDLDDVDEVWTNVILD
jgi:transcriptional/translational regulatory protein YebC/TACO1